jgi:ribose-phosphate pyrophosphokinase
MVETSFILCGINAQRQVEFLKIIGGSASEALASKVAHELDREPAKIEFNKFPDGEKYLRILDDVKGEDVVVIQSINRTPDEFLVEYLLIVDTLKDLGATKVVGFIPYFAYARQDERFKPGEAFSFKTVSKLIEIVGTDELYTIDMHKHRVVRSTDLFKIPSQNLTAMPLLADYVEKTGNLQNPLVIGPDAEAAQWAKVAAERLRTDYDVFEKKRLGSESVQIRPGKLNVKDRDVLIVDDIISTSGTVVAALEILFSQGARKIDVACTHPLLMGNALAKIHETGAKNVIGTDTVPSPVSCVSVAPLIAEEIKKAGFR